MTITAGHHHITRLSHKDKLADDARLELAGRSHGNADCRELGLMLGLMTIDSNGSLATANPWDADVDDTRPSSPEG